MTRRHSRGRGAAHDSADPDLFFGTSRNKQRSRKDDQLCSQIQQALSEALAADFGDELLNSLWVVDVVPAPTAARVLVWVTGPPGVPAQLILERLQRVSGALRTEVGAAIHRKLVPHLEFAIHVGEVEEP
jgi:ribosome-binding factor A